MGNTCGNICSNAPKEDEINIVKFDDKAVTEQSGRPHKADLEEQFVEMLREVYYPNNAVKRALEEHEPFEFNRALNASDLSLVTKDCSVPGETYYGFVNANKQVREYKGVIVYDDGSVYQGHFANDLPNGKGRKLFASLDFFEGDFENGRTNGHGKFIRPDGYYYEGDWKNSKQEGQGSEEWKNGERYVGSYKNGLKDGNGMYLWGDGSKYEGNFVRGEKEGIGTYSGMDGEHYEGEWIGGVEHGRGVMKYSDGQVYTGEFKYSKKDGEGELKVPGEGTWEGTWVEDRRVGAFKLIANDKVIKRVDYGTGIDNSMNRDIDPTDEKERVSNSIISIEKWSEEKSLAQIADNDADAI